jgi:hypothetical protein
MNHLLEHGAELIVGGYEIIPIAHKKKFPPLKEWQKIKATASDVHEWVKDGHTGVGVLCKNTPAVDLDIRNLELTKQMIREVRDIATNDPRGERYSRQGYASSRDGAEGIAPLQNFKTFS